MKASFRLVTTCALVIIAVVGVRTWFRHVLYGDSFHLSVADGDLPSVRRAVEQGYDANSANKSGYTPLHLAVYNDRTKRGDHAMTRFLLSCGASTDVYNCYGYTPLYLASFGDNEQIVSMLLGNGADVNARNPHSLETPIFAAISANQQKVVRILIQHKADLNAKDRFGQTPVYRASRKSAGIMLDLLENGADPRMPAASGSAVVIGVLNQCVMDNDQEGALEKIRSLVKFGAEYRMPYKGDARPDSRVGCALAEHAGIQESETPLQYAERMKLDKVSLYLRGLIGTESAGDKASVGTSASP